MDDATLVVHVNGAAEQLDSLSDRITGVGHGRSLQASLDVASRELARGHTQATCASLGVFITAVTVQTPRHIDVETSASLVGDARRIRAVVACPAAA